MPERPACPDATSLERFVQGLVPDADAAPMERHLEHCALCAQTLSGMHGKDLLVQRLQEGRSVADELPNECIVEELIRSVDALRSRAGESLHDTMSSPRRPGVSLSAILAPPEIKGEIGRLGRFRILSVIGEGGMGAVLAAEDPKLGRAVAVKVVQPARAEDASARSRFLREARAAAAVTHDNIVSVYEVDEDRGILYLVMPLLAGESLQARLQRQGPLPTSDVARLGRQIAEGLAAAHARGLIHRDIKPTNIWLEELPTGYRAKILDFGLARLTQDDARMTSDGVILGTPAYIAPEQARGQPVDARADLFSLGCVLYQAATGRLPWGGADTISAMLARFMETPKSPSSVNRQIPGGLSDLIMWLLAREPAERPQTAAAVAQALATFEDGPSTQVLPKYRWKRRSRRRLPMLIVATAFAVILAPLIILGTYGRWFRSGPPVAVPPETPHTPGPHLYPRVKLDDLQREKIDPYELRIAGRGDAAKAPAELVALLGDSRFNDTQPLTFNGDGTELITTCGDGMIRAWDTTTGQERRQLPLSAFKGEISPDGKLVALGVGDGNIKILDAVTWTEPFKLKQVHTQSVWSLAFSTDSRMLAVKADNRATVWDMKTGANLLTITCGGGGAVGFRDNGKTLIVSADGRLKLFEVATGKPQPEIENKPGFEWPSFSPDGRLFIQGGDAESLADTTGAGKVVLEGGAGYTPRRGVFSADGRMIAIGGRDNIVRVWDTATGKRLHEFKGHIHGFYTSVTALAFSRDGKLLASGGDDRRTRIWDLTKGNERLAATAHAGPVTTVAFNPQGTILASGGMDQTIRMWNLSTLKSAYPVREHKFDITHVAFSPDGQLLASASTGHPSVGDARELQLRHVLGMALGHYGFLNFGNVVPTFAFSPDRETFAAAVQNKAILLDSVSFETLRELPHRWPVHGVAFSPDGRTLAASSAHGNEVQLWTINRPARGVVQAEEAGLLPGGMRIAFTPDSKSLVTAKPSLIQVFDLKQRKERTRLAGPDGLGGRTISITADGRWLAVTDGGGCQLWLWDLELANPVARTILLASSANGCSFSSDSRHIAVGHDNGTISMLRLIPASGSEDKR
jgi:eukaryotic-like serine/threonine-protein kinase